MCKYRIARNNPRTRNSKKGAICYCYNRRHLLYNTWRYADLTSPLRDFILTTRYNTNLNSAREIGH